jgi:phosphatidylglycerol:prolipoprotein diacylglycerol transferase
LGVEYVEFPGLGLKLPVSRVLFNVFGLNIYAYAVIIAFALVLMIFLGLRASDRFGIKKDDIIDMMIFAIPVSIICARLYYVIFSWDYYKDDLLSVLNVRQGGLAIYGAVIGAFATVFVFARVRKISPLAMLDFGAPYLILAQGIGRWGNFVNQEAFGVNTTLPWGMTSAEIAGKLGEFAPRLEAMGIQVDAALPVHPTFLYESLWNIAVAALLFRLRGRKHFNGEVLFCYLIGYGIGRAFIEGLRTDSLMLGGERISQLLSMLFVLVCSILLAVFRYKNPARMTMEAIMAGGGAGSAGADDAADRITGLDYKLSDVDALGGEGEGESEAEGGDGEAGGGGSAEGGAVGGGAGAGAGAGSGPPDGEGDGSGADGGAGADAGGGGVAGGEGEDIGSGREGESAKIGGDDDDDDDGESGGEGWSRLKAGRRGRGRETGAGGGSGGEAEEGASAGVGGSGGSASDPADGGSEASGASASAEGGRMGEKEHGDGGRMGDKERRGDEEQE